jgi:exosome complex exonuclease DIS3/RRP44
MQITFQTVLEEVRHRSSPVYKRLKDVIADAERRAFFVFVNEHHAETYVERKPGESANDRNDRAIRTAARWFGEHAVQKGGCDKDVGVVLLTDDVDNRNKAKKEGGIAGVYSVTDYVRSMSDNKMLADKLKVKDDNKENKSGSGGKRFLFPEHMSPAQINAGVKSKAILKGVFYLSRTNYLEGTVNCEGIEQPVLIQGLEQMNRAVDGDHVAVKLLEKKAWSAPAEIILDDDAGNADPGDTLEDGAKKLLDEAVKKNEDVQVMNWKELSVYCRCTTGLFSLL